MNHILIVSYKKMNILLPIFLTSALILGPLSMGVNAFAQGGKNAANQGIAQCNNAAQDALCLLGLLPVQACNTTTNQGNANAGSNTAGQTAGGGTGTGAGGGTNNADQTIVKPITLHKLHYVLLELLQVQHATLLQTNVMKCRK